MKVKEVDRLIEALDQKNYKRVRMLWDEISREEGMIIKMHHMLRSRGRLAELVSTLQHIDENKDKWPAIGNDPVDW